MSLKDNEFKIRSLNKLPRVRCVLQVPIFIPEGGGKRGHVVAHVSWVGKRFVLCPCRANGETFVADTKCF